MKNFIKSKWFKFGTYILLMLTFFLVGHVLLDNNKALNKVFTSFFDVAENRSFDYRQRLKIAHMQNQVNKDIVILAIDDASLELLWNEYGEWPIPRNIYADIINYIEKDSPKAIILDLLFIKSVKSNLAADNYLISTINKYNNVYTSMNFDAQHPDVRVPINLPDRLSYKNIGEKELKLANKYKFSNCRNILQGFIDGNTKIGIVNVARDNDGIIREVAPVMQYKGIYYPYIALNSGVDLLSNKNIKDFKIDKNSNFIIGDTVIPLTEDGDTILNWYGTSQTHTTYPLYKLVNQMKGKVIGDKIDLKDKIVLIGTTATSLHDIKSVPVQDGIYPGVEVIATFLNNVFDNNFIKYTSYFVDVLLVCFVVIVVGFIVMLSSSTILALMSTMLFTIAYLFVSYYSMTLYNLWIPIVIPVTFIVISFALSYLVKYMIKSRDFEYQYKLATVDGLTELYNHRYFQETLKNHIELSSRYNQEFSLIIIDIDYFKKFNDKYGHQAGDAVLKQVAQLLKKNSRATDIVCRYGGEEMTIILPNTGLEEALLNANRINKAVAEKPFQMNSSQTANVTISVGVATFPNHAQSAQELIEFADKGLYYAKEHGRNQVKCISQE